jgi:hypothetical protein
MAISRPVVVLSYHIGYKQNIIRVEFCIEFCIEFWILAREGPKRDFDASIL